MAERAWPGENPIGKVLRLGNDYGQGPWRRVVGVVADRRYLEITHIRPTVYIPLRQAGPGPVVVVRTKGDPYEALPTVERVLARIDVGYKVGRAISIGDILDQVLARPRFVAGGLGALATAAAVVAAIGLFAGLSAYVREHTREIGIRAALGATPSELRAFIMRRAVAEVILGTAVGLVLAAAGMRLLRSVLFDVARTAPMAYAYAAVALAMVVVTLVAAYAPATRASRVDPVTALRSG
jgi:hypothetical protein